MVFPRASKSTPALNRAMLNVLNATYQTRGVSTKMWNVADTCPLFLKKSVVRKAGVKKRSYRRNGALSSHTIKTLSSGAAANAALLAQTEAETLRCSVTAEPQKYPLLPSVSKGATALIEAAFIAYMQEAFGNAVALKSAVGKHQKVTQRCAQMGVDALNERIAQATAFVPATVVPKIPNVGKKTK